MKGYNFKMKRIIILKQNGENIKSLIITDNDLIIEKNSKNTDKLVKIFIKKSKLSYEELLENKDIVELSNKSYFEQAKTNLKAYSKYMKYKSKFKTSSATSLIVVCALSYLFNHYDTVFLNGQHYIMLCIYSFLNTITLWYTTALNAFHRKYKLGRNTIGNSISIFLVSLSLCSWINYCVPIKTIPYYLAVKNTESIENVSREESVEKLYKDIQKSPYLDEDKISYLNNLKTYILKNEFLDIDELYQTFMTIKTEEKEFLGAYGIGGTYNINLNEATSYKGVTSLSEECIFTHEFIHATGGFEMQVLDEGYTSILTSSMLGTDKRIDGYDRYRWCVEEILHLVDKNIVLESYSKRDQSILDNELSNILGGQENVEELYNLFYDYVDGSSSKEAIYFYIHRCLDSNFNDYQEYVKSVKDYYSFENDEKLILTK